MNSRYVTIAIALLLASTSRPSCAFDLSGAWATDASTCSKIFKIGRGGAISIKQDSDLYGSGFILRGKQIIGKIAKCTIRAKTEHKDIVYFVAACSTDIALSNVEFEFKIKNDNEIIRNYPQLEELNMTYFRCEMK